MSNTTPHKRGNNSSLAATPFNLNQRDRVSTLTQADSTKDGNSAAYKCLEVFQEENSINITQEMNTFDDKSTKEEFMIECMIRLAEFFAKPVKMLGNLKSKKYCIRN